MYIKFIPIQKNKNKKYLDTCIGDLEYLTGENVLPCMFVYKKTYLCVE